MRTTQNPTSPMPAVDVRDPACGCRDRRSLSGAGDCPDQEGACRSSRDDEFARARDQGRLREPQVRPAGRIRLCQRRQQPLFCRRAAHRHDLVVSQPALTRDKQLFLTCPIRSIGAMKRVCSVWLFIPSSRRTSSSSCTTRPMTRARGVRLSRVSGASSEPADGGPGERRADLGLGRGPV